jgi:hypothetical protein
MAGRRFARITVLQDLPFQNRRTQVLCRCDCGTEFISDSFKVRTGHTNSCGCYMRERIVETFFKHGHGDTVVRSRTYDSWKRMLRRCRSPNDISFPNYGGRGILVCDRWRSFENFLADVGERPSGTFLGRIDNNGHYEPGNVRWETRLQQNRNKRTNRVLTIRGVTGCLTLLCEHFRVNKKTVSTRLCRGWLPEDAFFKPLQWRGPH